MEEKVILNLETYNNLVSERNDFENKMFEEELERKKVEEKLDRLEDFFIEKTFYTNWQYQNYKLEDLLNVEHSSFNDEYKECIDFGIDLEKAKYYVKKRYEKINKKEEKEEE